MCLFRFPFGDCRVLASPHSEEIGACDDLTGGRAQMGDLFLVYVHH